MAAAVPIAPAQRKQIIKVLFISLLLDLISFTFILPLFPALLAFYRDLEVPSSPNASPSLLSRILTTLNTYKNAFSRPISSRYDIVLLGGALGSLFSLLQALASPLIGRLSDTHGRRTALLWSMAGNLLSVALWVAATDFRTFLASRVVGGLSEGNVQLATAIATDISSDAERGATMALVGACFCIAFTFGPALGAALASFRPVKANPFVTAASFSLALITVETIYLYLYLPETLPSTRARAPSSPSNKSPPTTTPPRRTNSKLLLNATHFFFILFFSGIEFSLPFLTYDLFGYSSSQTGRLLGFMGLIASLLQASATRRLHPLTNVRLGVTCCALSFLLLGAVQTQLALYVAAAVLSVTTATVVTGLNALSSFEAAEHERGGVLGNHRSWGQVGRSCGPLVFCTLYWWAGREVAYAVGGVGMLGVVAVVGVGLRKPPGTEVVRKGRGKRGVAREVESEKEVVNGKVNGRANGRVNGGKAGKAG
ncbi:MAG: hypothetical protein M1824_002780 [Vezdaea acicularis]|nr:MAG: hypothetical protein M1824_002780 [Vezdaea acicularis]